MNTNTAADSGATTKTRTAESTPLSLTGEIQGRIRTCRPARTDREPEDPAQDWNIVRGED
ncbi:hypothetical protein [Streptomyces sp. NPDC047928]|uniref:hypothetical protein n=1 Tax=unclassified Streptomyces TaxID=2593676 RepID=UPI0037155155